MDPPDPYFVPTKSSILKNKTHPHEVVEHREERKSMLTTQKQIVKKATKSNDSERLEMKDVRFELFKFAQSALPASEKLKSKKELAVKLGAKPLKSKPLNYKELKEKKKKELEDAKIKNELYNVPVSSRIAAYKSKLNKGALRRKRTIGSGILNVYGKVSKKDLRKKKE